MCMITRLLFLFSSFHGLAEIIRTCSVLDRTNELAIQEASRVKVAIATKIQTIMQISSLSPKQRRPILRGSLLYTPSPCSFVTIHQFPQTQLLHIFTRYPAVPFGGILSFVTEQHLVHRLTLAFFPSSTFRMTSSRLSFLHLLLAPSSLSPSQLTSWKKSSAVLTSSLAALIVFVRRDSTAGQSLRGTEPVMSMVFSSSLRSASDI